MILRMISLCSSDTRNKTLLMIVQIQIIKKVNILSFLSIQIDYSASLWSEPRKEKVHWVVHSERYRFTDGEDQNISSDSDWR